MKNTSLLADFLTYNIDLRLKIFIHIQTTVSRVLNIDFCSWGGGDVTPKKDQKSNPKIKNALSLLRSLT